MVSGKKYKVWVNGTFDVLHYGHIKLLEFASTLGDVTVGIDSDERVRELKGKNRPFNNQNFRKFMLESVKYVKEVVVYNTREELINSVKINRPDYMVIGDDYKDQIVYGSEYVIKELIFYKKIPDISTSKILNYYKND